MTESAKLQPADVDVLLVGDVGALGSAHTSRARRGRLAQMGLIPRQIDRFDAPAGVSIGSKRPPEIALSIVAGITAARNGIGKTGR